MRLYECLGMDKTFSDMLKCLLYTFFLLINLNWDFVIILTALIVIDMFFGVVKSLFLHRNISVKTFLSGLCVKLMFLIIPMVVAVLGMAIAGVGWKIQLNRTEQLESLLSESQKNERLLQGKIISCKEEAQKDAIQSVYENMEMIKRCEM